MILNQKQQKICNKYIARDEAGYVHCYECPLRKGTDGYDFHCAANSHYDRRTREWEYNEIKVHYIPIIDREEYRHYVKVWLAPFLGYKIFKRSTNEQDNNRYTR